MRERASLTRVIVVCSACVAALVIVVMVLDLDWGAVAGGAAIGLVVAIANLLWRRSRTN